MKPEDFISKPWPEASLHPCYKESFLHMRPAPEYASGEVLLASLYRNVGFSVSEGTTPQRGRDLLKCIAKSQRRGGERSLDKLSADSWEAIVCRSLSSPKQPNQASRRFLQICPIVPDAALYSLSARMAKNTWNPGSLVAKAIDFGTSSEEEAALVWEKLFQRLGIEGEEDIWAKFLQGQFERWRSSDLKDEWNSATTFKSAKQVVAWRKSACDIPAKRFVEDLMHVLNLKCMLTRRQWVSMVESVLRIGAASHIQWLCHANAKCLKLFEEALQGHNLPSRISFEGLIEGKDAFWRYGQKATQGIQAGARQFVVARAALNLLLWHCEQLKTDGHLGLPANSLQDLESIYDFATKLNEVRDKFPYSRFRADLQAALEEDPRVVACKRGISSNVSEFLGHVLRQRQTSETGMSSYDQGFYLRKSGRYASAPWIVSMGPVAVISLVHCCVKGGAGPRTVEDFCNHLSYYGIETRTNDILEGDLGNTLRNLGLVLDSPDAEGGMVLFSPLNRPEQVV